MVFLKKMLSDAVTDWETRKKCLVEKSAQNNAML